MELLANVDVDDLDKAIDFYSNAFDLKVGRRLPFGAEMLGASSAIYLLPKTPGSPAASTTSQPRDYNRHWTPVHLDFVVPEIRAAVHAAVSAGATPEGAVQTHAWGYIAQLADPFGNGFCLIEFLGDGYDEET